MPCGTTCAAADFEVAGSNLTVGMTQSERSSLIHKGDQRLLLIINDVGGGPRKVTTHDVELMYKKYDTLRIVSDQATTCEYFVHQQQCHEHHS